MIGNKKGNIGEKFASDFLKKQGYTIIKENFTNRYGEIDIIAEKDDYIVFVEVKARKVGTLVSAAESVTPEKQKKIITSSMKFLQDFDRDLQPRYDVITIELVDERVCAIRHIVSAFDTENYA